MRTVLEKWTKIVLFRLPRLNPRRARVYPAVRPPWITLPASAGARGGGRVVARAWERARTASGAVRGGGALRAAACHNAASRGRCIRDVEEEKGQEDRSPPVADPRQRRVRHRGDQEGRAHHPLQGRAADPRRGGRGV